jgi:hypothetical protein
LATGPFRITADVADAFLAAHAIPVYNSQAIQAGDAHHGAQCCEPGSTPKALAMCESWAGVMDQAVPNLQRELAITRHHLPGAIPTSRQEREESSDMASKIEKEDHSVAEVDRIRDIIFGPQMRLYEQHFQRVTSQLEALGKQIEELRTALHQQATDQESQTRKVQEELRQALDGQKRELTTRLEQQGAEQQQQMRQLAADLRTQGQNLQGEFTAALDRLDNEKASRHNLGDLLMEAGMRLKQQMGIVDLLGQLQEAPVDEARE